MIAKMTICWFHVFSKTVSVRMAFSIIYVKCSVFSMQTNTGLVEAVRNCIVESGHDWLKCGSISAFLPGPQETQAVRVVLCEILLFAPG